MASGGLYLGSVSLTGAAGTELPVTVAALGPLINGTKLSVADSIIDGCVLGGTKLSVVDANIGTCITTPVTASTSTLSVIDGNIGTCIIANANGSGKFSVVDSILDGCVNGLKLSVVDANIGNCITTPATPTTNTVEATSSISIMKRPTKVLMTDGVLAIGPTTLLNPLPSITVGEAGRTQVCIFGVLVAVPTTLGETVTLKIVYSYTGEVWYNTTIGDIILTTANQPFSVEWATAAPYVSVYTTSSTARIAILASAV